MSLAKDLGIDHCRQMNGIMFLILIHLCLWRRRRARDSYFQLEAKLIQFQRACESRDYSLQSVPRPDSELEAILRKSLQEQLLKGRFELQSWSLLCDVWTEIQDELRRLQKFEAALFFHAAVASVACFAISCVLGQNMLMWIQLEWVTLPVWCFYFGVLHGVLAFYPRPSLLLTQRISKFFLRAWLGSATEGPWEEDLRVGQERMWRDGRHNGCLESAVLSRYWSEEKQRFQRQLAVWEELLPVFELFIFAFLAVGLWMQPLLSNPIFSHELGSG